MINWKKQGVLTIKEHFGNLVQDKDQISTRLVIQFNINNQINPHIECQLKFKCSILIQVTLV